MRVLLSSLVFRLSYYIEPSDISQLTPRLFQLKSETGTFISEEITSPAKTDTHNCPFPVLQDDLYYVDQPGRFFFFIRATDL